MEDLYGIKINDELVDICQSLDSVQDAIGYAARDAFRERCNSDGAKVSFKIEVVKMTPVENGTLTGKSTPPPSNND